MAVAIMGWCVAIQGADIHEAAELGDLERVKAYLSQDPKQIDLVDAKGNIKRIVQGEHLGTLVRDEVAQA